MRIRNDISIQKDKRRNKWLVRWWGKYDLNAEKQPRFCKTFDRKKDAESFVKSLKTDRDDGMCIEPETISLGKLSTKFLRAVKSSVAGSSYDSYRNTTLRLKEYFGVHKNIKTIKKEHAEAFIADIKLERYKPGGDPSDSTRAQHLRGAKLIFNRAVDWEYIRKNPFKGITVGKIKKEKWHYITPKEFKSLMNVIDNLPVRKNKKSNIAEDQDRFNKTMIKAFYCVMYGCGLRFGEAANLMWKENIDSENAKIKILNRSSSNGYPPFYLKDYEERFIDAPVWVMDALSELKKISSPHNPYVFLSDKRLKLVEAKWQEMVSMGLEKKWLNTMVLLNTHRKFSNYCKWAGINTTDRLSVHCLRKAYGTNLADLGTPVHTLKSLMGHSNIQTTMEFYLHVSDENKKKAVEGLNGLLDDDN